MRCTQLKANGRQCRQNGGPNQTGGPVIEYPEGPRCAYHAPAGPGGSAKRAATTDSTPPAKRPMRASKEPAAALDGRPCDGPPYPGYELQTDGAGGFFLNNVEFESPPGFGPEEPVAAVLEMCGHALTYHCGDGCGGSLTARAGFDKGMSWSTLPSTLFISRAAWKVFKPTLREQIRELRCGDCGARVKTVHTNSHIPFDD